MEWGERWELAVKGKESGGAVQKIIQSDGVKRMMPVIDAVCVSA